MTDAASDEPRPTVVNDEASRRFVIAEGAMEAFLQYRTRADRLILVHTEVPPKLGGRGLAGELIRTAIDHAEAHRLTVVPLCPLARSWLMRHADVSKRVTIDWVQDADD
jgi:predicted GNAT family acetyltransferase